MSFQVVRSLSNVASTSNHDEGPIKRSMFEGHYINLCGGTRCMKNVNRVPLNQEQTYKFALEIFGKLKTVAAEGETSCRISSGFATTFKALQLSDQHAILKHIQEVFLRLSIRLTFPSSRQQAGHDVFCTTTSLESIEVRWERDNSLLIPKPTTPLTEPAITDKLNALRKEGHGTTFTLVFGEGHTFKVHPFIACVFSEAIKVISSQGKEQETKTIPFPEMDYLSKEELELLVDCMYTDKLDLAKVSSPATTALRFLGASDFLQSKSLRAQAFNYIMANVCQLTPREQMELLYEQIVRPFAELDSLCKWFVKTTLNPSDLLQGEIDGEVLLVLLAIGTQYDLPEVKKKIEMMWQEATLQEKIEMATLALRNSYEGSLQLFEEMCKSTLATISRTDPLRADFIKAYKAINDRLFTVRIGPNV